MENTKITIEIEITPDQMEALHGREIVQELKRAAQKKLAEVFIEELTPSHDH